MERPRDNTGLGSGERRRKSAWSHLALLLWKSLLLRRRHWLLTLFEVILPIGLFSVILFIRLIPGSNFGLQHYNQTIPDPTQERYLRQSLCWEYGNWDYMEDRCVASLNTPSTIYYGPNTSFTRDVAYFVAEELGLPEKNIRSVASNDEIDTLVKMSYYSSNTSYYQLFNLGLFFYLDDPGSQEPPPNLDYDLRLPGNWYTMGIYDFLQLPGPNYFSNPYEYNGFTMIQSLVDRKYTAMISNNNTYLDDYTIEIQAYPYPAYDTDNGLSFLYSTIIPSFLVLALVLLSPSLIKSVVHEKDTGVRELVCLMGMNRWLVWLGWFLHSALLNIVIITAMAIMLLVSMHNSDGTYVPPILAFSDGGYVWLMLFLYGISSIAFCLAISTFFNRPTLAMTVGILVWILSYSIPNNLMYYKYDRLGQAPKILSCLLPNMAITWGFKVIQMFEGRNKGVHWNTVWETGNPRDQLTPAAILLMLAFDTFLYLFITWYVDQVNPGTYGVPQPWYFPFQRTYWCGTKKEDHSGHSEEGDSEDQQYFEKVPAGLKPGIVIRNLRKEFKELGRKTKVAVENVSLTCYEGQCTVLLGHNGAGKTTTMSVLTGVYGATSGYAEVNGWNIATNLSEAREELGLCPQHNMLFVDLTVLQHLLFFGRLKGMTSSAAEAEAHEILTKLELMDKQLMFGNQLSGGMKRKLSLAISLMGSTKVVILDEPSSGLDPESRRWVWDVVQGERGRRTFLITTHHMEEADVLGDRVAIMFSGRVVCAGSTLFLKKKFDAGDGYTLTMMVDDETHLEAIKDQVHEHLSAANLVHVHSGELTFKLPPTTQKFAAMLDALSARKEELGMRHVSLSVTSMERVFLRVGEIMEGGHTNARNSSSGGNAGTDVSIPVGENRSADNTSTNSDDIESAYANSRLQLFHDNKLKGRALEAHRLKALLLKRIIYAQRKWVLLITQALIPVAVSIICLVVDQTIQVLTNSEPPLKLGLDLFSSTASFANADPNQMPLMDQYTSLFSPPHQVSTTSNMTGSLLQAAAENLQYYRENSICSAEFLDESLPSSPKNNTLRMLYQTIPHHTLGISTLLVDNALLRMASNSSIEITNRPLPKDTTWQFRTDFSTSALVYSSVMPLALCFLSASFLIFPLQERESKAKQIQVMTGTNVWTLWYSSFTWDFLTYLLTAVLIFIFFAAINPNDLFSSSEAQGALYLLLLLYGWSSIPLSYVFSFLFSTAASGFAILALVNIVAGQMLSLVVYVLDLTDSPPAETAGDVLHWISSIIPAYPVSVGFRHLVQTSVQNSFCDKFTGNITAQICTILGITDPKNTYVQCCPGVCGRPNTTPCFEWTSYFQFDKPGMAADMLTLFVDGVIFFVLIQLIEAGMGSVVKRWWWECSGKAGKFRRLMNLDQDVHRDEDVEAEEERVKRKIVEAQQQNSTGTMDTTMLVSGLSKHYLGSIVPAVRQVSFSLGRGECLGLLGVNGAGKTTTFRMLTGDTEPSGGDALIRNVSLVKQRSTFVKQIGYCPQFDAIMGELTGREMLCLIGRLRGVNDQALKQEVAELVELVDLTECVDRPSSTFSGGNKRKLSTAMALVGSPSLVFLDEPTTGVDPAARRRVWTAVSRAVANGQSVVLTSHSMEECEALCSRIIVMSRGALRCVGTTGHLKAKFGQGYNLQVKLRTHDLSSEGEEQNERVYDLKLAELKNTLHTYFPGASISDEHKGMIVYRIPKNISWGLMFSVMENLKAGREPGSEAHPDTQPTEETSRPSFVEDYAASDTSLEQVFLSFAREANAAVPSAIGVGPVVVSQGGSTSVTVPQVMAATGATGTGTPQDYYTYSVPKEQQLPMSQVNRSSDLLTDL